MQISRKATLGLVTAFALAAGGTATAVVAAPGAQPQNQAASVAQPAAQASANTRISQDQAVQTALSQSPGSVLEKARYERKENYWDIDLKPSNGQGQHVDYKIDASSGKVLSTEVDSQHSVATTTGTGAAGTGSHEGHTPAQEQAHAAKEKAEKVNDRSEHSAEKVAENQED